jgi:hypothetical protein
VPSSDPDIAAAERLARIAVSDVILYNEPKFAAAIKAGNVAKALAVELEEARQHFNSRVSPICARTGLPARRARRRAAAQSLSGGRTRATAEVRRCASGEVRAVARARSSSRQVCLVLALGACGYRPPRRPRFLRAGRSHDRGRRSTTVARAGSSSRSRTRS